MKSSKSEKLKSVSAQVAAATSNGAPLDEPEMGMCVSVDPVAGYR